MSPHTLSTWRYPAVRLSDPAPLESPPPCGPAHPYGAAVRAGAAVRPVLPFRSEAREPAGVPGGATTIGVYAPPPAPAAALRRQWPRRPRRCRRGRPAGGCGGSVRVPGGGLRRPVAAVGGPDGGYGRRDGGGGARGRSPYAPGPLRVRTDAYVRTRTYGRAHVHADAGRHTMQAYADACRRLQAHADACTRDGVSDGRFPSCGPMPTRFRNGHFRATGTGRGLIEFGASMTLLVRGARPVLGGGDGRRRPRPRARGGPVPERDV